jgi:hypothetical protein
MRARSGILIGVLSIGAAACASSGSTASQKKSCDLRPEDAKYALGAPLYRDCAVELKAHLQSTTRPDFQSSARSACYAVDLEFVVDTAGRPEPQTVRVVRTNDQSFAQATASTVPQWKYTPAQVAGHPVRQIVSERQSVSTMVSVAPAGSGPPSRGALPRSQKC